MDTELEKVKKPTDCKVIPKNGLPRDDSVDSYTGVLSTDDEILDPLTPLTCHNTNQLAEISCEIISDLLIRRRLSSTFDTLVGQNVLLSLPPSDKQKIIEEYKQFEDSSTGDENSFTAQFQGKQIFESPAHPLALSEFVLNRVLNASIHAIVINAGTSTLMKNRNRDFFLKHFTETFFEKSLDTSHPTATYFLQKLEAADTLLELLGTKFTSFGKNVNMLRHFDVHTDITNFPVGSTLTAFLLDTPFSSPDQSNFLIFHILANHAPPKVKESLSMDTTKAANEYLLLKTSTKVETELTFARVNELLELFDIRQEKQDEFWAVLAAILHLGEIEFAETDTASSIQSKAPLDNVQKLLNIEVNKLEQLFENTSKPKAQIYLKLLISELYRNFFEVLKAELSQALKLRGSKLQHGNLGNISVIDSPVFAGGNNDNYLGFVNKLKVNFLQDLYVHVMNELLLRQKQAVYVQDNVDWKMIEYNSPSERLNMVGMSEENMFNLLDAELSEETMKTPSEIKNLILTKFQSSEHLRKPSESSAKSTDPNKRASHASFAISHIYGEGIYTIENLEILSKNEEYKKKVEEVLKESHNRFASGTRPEETEEESQENHAADSVGIRCSEGIDGFESIREYATKLLEQALSGKTEGYFMFSLHPNRKREQEVNNKFVTVNLRSINVNPLTQMSQKGYVLSMGYSVFLKRYKMLTQYTWPVFNGRNDLQGILIMLHILGLAETCKLGDRMIHVQSMETFG